MKFLHTMGAIGLMGTMAALLVMMSYLPDATSLNQSQALTKYATLRGAMGGIATWVLLPSLGLTVIAGLLAFAVNRTFQRARWALVKLAMGVVLFEGTLIAIQGPMQREAELSAKVLEGGADVGLLASRLGGETAALWIMMAVATANVVLGVWRPRLARSNVAAT